MSARAAADVAVALVATATELVLLNDGTGAGVTANVVTALAGSALIVRRRAPLPVLAATLTAGATAVAVGGMPGGVIVLVALYTTAAACEHRVSLVALAPTIIVVIAMSVATADADDRQASAPEGALGAAVLTGGVWALGAYVQTRRRYVRELEERALRVEREREQLARIAVHEERASIARELHDIVAHSVSVMLVGVRGARDVLRTAPDVADATLGRVEATGEQSVGELRRILALLRDREQGAESRPQPSLAELDELVADSRAAGLPVALEVVGQRRPLGGGVELCVYRIVQEALTNVLKHTQPTRVIVTLVFAHTRLDVEVVDDGTPVGRAAGTTGHGIVGMRERVALLGGALETGPRVGGGFRVTAQLPIGGPG
jgi:signal transduction histidine kinase